jgi:uncharacterized protein YecT (DUF1311 family)
MNSAKKTTSKKTNNNNKTANQKTASKDQRLNKQYRNTIAHQIETTMRGSQYKQLTTDDIPNLLPKHQRIAASIE